MTEVPTMIEECQEHEQRLSQWEREFIDSVDAQDYELTDAQFEKLSQIWRRVTA